MKSIFTIFAVLAFFTLGLVSCENPVDSGQNPPELPRLTIKNESSYVLTEVKFSGLSFAAANSTELPPTSQAVKQLSQDDLNKAGYITFVRKDIGIVCRTDAALTLSDTDETFTFTDQTVVVEQGNTENRKILAQITFISQLGIEYGGLNVARNDTVNMGEAITGSAPKQTEFVLKNTGVGKLLLNGNEPVKISGADVSGVFAVVQPSNPEIAPNGSLSFKINFSPQAVREYTGTVTVSTNDPSGDFSFTVNAAGVASKSIIGVWNDTTEIPQNGTINAGEVLISQTKNIEVLLKNTGQLTLQIDTANIAISGVNASAFSIETRPGGNISSGSDSRFIIQCAPTTAGEHNAILTIPTNDSSRNPAVVYLKVTAVQGDAVLELSQGSTGIANNAITPFDFGSVEIGTNKSLTFTIKNTGNIPLELTGVPVVESSNTVFTVPAQPANKTIAPGATVQFNIRYTPAGEQESTATISISNNGSGLEFSFTVKGTGFTKKSQITVTRGVTTINPHDEYDFGAIASGKHSDITFTIGNSGEVNLTFVDVNNNRVNLEDNTSGYFTVTNQPSVSTQVTPGNATTFVVRFNPMAVVNNVTATVRIKTNSRDNDDFSFRVKGSARAANSNAQLSALWFSEGTLDPAFNSNIYAYNLRIEAGSATLVNVRPTSSDSNVTVVTVNGVPQASGVLSQDIILAQTSTVTIVVTAEDGTSTQEYTANIKIVRTWEKLHGVAGQRYGVFRAVGNGEGGLYAGGYTGNSTAALFNIDQSGNIKNTFTYSSFDGTVGPTGIGSVYNEYFSVYSASRDDTGSINAYSITKTSSPNVSPSNNRTSMNYNEEPVYMYALGIARNSSGYYFVAGTAEFIPNAASGDYHFGIFVNRHYNDGSWEKGMCLLVPTNAGIMAETFEVVGMTLLGNGDVLLYGSATTTTGRDVAFACAVNVSDNDSGKWSVRWTNVYEISGKTTDFRSHFFDSSSNIVLVGTTDDGGLVVKFPASATTAAAAKPSGWSKVIAGTNGILNSGLALRDGSGYLFVGGGTGSHGGTDVWVIKTDSNAVKTWEKFFGGAGEDYCDVVVEAEDGFLLAGSTTSPAIAGQSKKGTEDMYILKINKDGTMD